MKRKWNYWLAAASVLLLVGAGCAADVQQSASVQTDAQPPSQEGTGNVKVEAKTGIETDVDATVDSALKETGDETAASMQENSDVGVVSNDSAELNAYGQAYDPNRL